MGRADLGRITTGVGELGATSGGHTSVLPGTLDRPEVTPDGGSGKSSEGWIVTVFNNDHNTWEEVIHILIVATGCSVDEAKLETWEIDNLGKSVVHHADKGQCEKVAAIIAQIGIEVKVSEE